MIKSGQGHAYGEEIFIILLLGHKFCCKLIHVHLHVHVFEYMYMYMCMIRRHHNVLVVVKYIIVWEEAIIIPLLDAADPGKIWVIQSYYTTRFHDIIGILHTIVRNWQHNCIVVNPVSFTHSNALSL